MKIYQPIAGLCLAAVLSACGGGGDSRTPETNPPGPSIVSRGVFIDSPVSGLGYVTNTQSGTTNANGEFSYVTGENITFSIGRIQFPTIFANATLTPLDVARTTDIDNQMVSNILVLLQSLDVDGNPANGISISPAATAAATSNISFDVTPAAFAANTTINLLLANSGSTNRTLISAAAARAHFLKTLAGNGNTAPVNVAPVAQAGKAQSLLTGAVVTLDASASSDANNDTLTYLWTLTSKPSGSTAVLDTPTAQKPTFKADVAGDYVASLIVNDGKLDSIASTVKITASVGNAAPVANAGSAQTVVPGSVVTLNGNNSSDANGDKLAYAWTLTSKPAGSTATLAADDTLSPTFTADLAGNYVATLVVNDGKVDSAQSKVTITAAAAFSVTSATYQNNQTIPNSAACSDPAIGGSNISPQLSLSNLPANTSKLAIVMDDETAPCKAGTEACVHWAVFNLPATKLNILAGENLLSETGATYGKTINNLSTGYFGPCPPAPTHTYKLTVYSLSADAAPVASGTAHSRASFEAAFSASILGKTTLTGTK